MKSFFWRFFWCIVPCAIAALITIVAIRKFQNGESGGFRLGVDLSGGTDLVYEIDLPKTRDTKEGTGFNPATQMNVLAEALKRRIDPNDLYNVVIRPVGEGRIEIVLPTGGTYRTRKAEQAWQDLLQEMTTTYFGKDSSVKLVVSRGRTFELADQIQTLLSTDKWENKLFRDQADDKDHLGQKAWDALKKEAVEYWAGLEPNRKDLDKLDSEPSRLKSLAAFVVKTLANNPDEGATTTDRVVETWIKRQAWDETMNRVRLKWPELKLEDYKDEMRQIQPDSFDQLTGFVQARGVLVAQAGLNVLEPLVGDQLSLGSEVPTRKEVEDFIVENYGESAQTILKKIDALSQKEGRGRDLNLEEVQRIKDLVAKVGALEFRILANSVDDKVGENAAKALINSEQASIQEQIKKAQEIGGAPPAPTDIFDITTANNQKSRVRYEWVELGPQERRSLGLDNNSKNEQGKDHAWKEAFFKSKSEKAFHISERAGVDRAILQGALFYRRDCKNRNLPEEERRKKEVEYFVLTRTPEYDLIDSSKQVPKLGGEYLTSAMVSVGDGTSPAASFGFNNEGGRLMGNITRKNVPSGAGGTDAQIKRHLAIILDDQVMSAPTINSIITSSGQISGNFTRKEVDNLVNVLRAGQLPATLKPQPVSETTMGATLGEDTIRAGLIAVGGAFAVVLIFMCVYYQFAGFVASIALLANLLLTVGFMVGVQATFTLPGLAGLVLMLGMAVDANVLIYERMREERERGAALPLALRNGYDRALPTIIDTHLSSIFTAIVLYVVGNDQLKGFGVSLTAGLVISLFTSLFMTRTIFDFAIKRGWFTSFNPFRLFARPNIDFMRIRMPMFTATLTLAILGLVLFVGRLPDDLNIDFIGGTAYSGKLNEHLSIAELRAYFDEGHQKKSLVLANDGVKEEAGSEGRRYQIRYQGEEKIRTVSFANKPEAESPAAREEIVRHRVTQFPDASVEQSFPSGIEYAKPNKTPIFTVRTSEKETEIVQAVLDRLLHDASGKELLKRVRLRNDPLTTRETRLYFEDPATEKAEFASPSFVRALFTRELMRQFTVTDKKDLPVQFDMAGDGKQNDDGSFSVVRLRFEYELKPDAKEKVEKALAATRDEFVLRPQPDRLENFDSQLATDTRYRAMWAVLASWAAILLYLWFRFGNWTFGLAAVVCLIHDLFLTLGVIAACHYLHGTFLGDMLALEDFKIDLPAVAALLTLVGYSVNDTIVVFDRIREVRGKNPDLTPKMINDSVNQTLSRTVLASLTTWLVVFVLYVWGGPGVHLFAFVMVAGVIVGTYSSIYIAAPLLLMLGEGVKEASPRTVSSTAIRPQIQGGKA